MQQLNVFARMRMFLVEGGFSYRSCFWITGLVAFWLSPIADNLTTAVGLALAVEVAVVARHAPAAAFHGFSRYFAVTHELDDNHVHVTNLTLGSECNPYAWVLMGAVVSNLGQGEHEYVAMCCVNIVVGPLCKLNPVDP
jgi:hypothetical protein